MSKTNDRNGNGDVQSSEGKGSDNDQQNKTFFTLEAMQNQFLKIENMFRDVSNKFERQDRLIRAMQESSNSAQRERASTTARNLQNFEADIVGYEEDDERGWYEVRNYGRGGRGDRGRQRGRAERRRDEEEFERVDRNIGSIKMKIPSFQGRNDAEAYLEWERKVEMIFACHNYSEEKKVKLAAVEFSDYAAVWWDQLLLNRRRARDRTVETWEEMKSIMRRRFVPSYYYRELHQKLQTLKQGTKSVEDYHKEMEMAMIRADIEEEREATMARFLAGLNKEIANIVELHHYVEIDEMVNMAMKIEKQLKNKSSSKVYNSGSSSSWSSKWPKKEDEGKDKYNDYKDRFKDKGTAPKGMNSHSNVVNASTKHRDIKCFKCLGSGHISSQCPNRKIMLLRDDGGIESQESEDEEMLELDDCSDVEVEQPVQVKALVVRRVLNVQEKIEVDEQRENIFHTRCLISGKMCSLIIDGGSCTNVASTILVEKLGLPIIKHPSPYRLQWLNECGEVRVHKQVKVAFSIGRYSDEILCDVVPMQASHILLGRPWQYDRRVIHDGYKNRYSFKKGDQTFVLAPLAPKEVHEDQIRLAKAMEEQKQREAESLKKKKGKEAIQENKNKGPIERDCTSEKKIEGSAIEKGELSKKKSEKKRVLSLQNQES